VKVEKQDSETSKLLARIEYLEDRVKQLEEENKQLKEDKKQCSLFQTNDLDF
jgi:cell division protein FtsB